MQDSGAAPLIRRAILSKKTPKANGNRGTLKMMGEKVLFPFVNSFIECKKPIIAMTQGNVVGVAFTILGLCDLVYAT